MAIHNAIVLLVSDEPVLSSLQFSLSVEGLNMVNGAESGADPSAAAAFVVDESYRGDGLSVIQTLRSAGSVVPVILLTTNPTPQLRARAAIAGAELIEKPLLGNELGHALRSALQPRKAA